MILGLMRTIAREVDLLQPLMNRGWHFSRKKEIYKALANEKRKEIRKAETENKEMRRLQP